MKLQVFCFLLLSLWILSCSDDEAGSGYDAGKPIVISSFLPDSGGVREKFVIQGENFGTDVSKIKVFFNKTEARILNSSGRTIYALVPRQPGDSCDIKVVVGDANVADSMVYGGKRFKYIVQASVSTIVGKEDANGSGGYVDGAYAEAMFDDPRGIAVDKDGSLLIMEVFPKRARLAVDNKVSTIMAGLSEYPSLITFQKDREVAYYPLNTSLDFAIFRMEKKKGYLPVEVVHLKKADYKYFHYVCNLAIDDDNNLYLFGRKDGAIVRFAHTTYKMDTIGYVHSSSEISGAYGVYNPLDKKLYWAQYGRHAIYRMNTDGSGVELFAGKVGVPGFQNGVTTQALFNEPNAMCVDSRGNIYVCDSKNHVVRQIDLEGFVTTLAGTPGKSGFNDGTPDDAKFYTPVGIDIDKDDFLYVADKDNSRIRKIAIE